MPLAAKNTLATAKESLEERSSTNELEASRGLLCTERERLLNRQAVQNYLTAERGGEYLLFGTWQTHGSLHDEQ